MNMNVVCVTHIEWCRVTLQNFARAGTLSVCQVLRVHAGSQHMDCNTRTLPHGCKHIVHISLSSKMHNLAIIAVLGADCYLDNVEVLQLIHAVQHVIILL